MLTETKVRIFTSSMFGAPPSSIAPGGLVAILDACLVAGFGLRTLGSGAITRVGNVVTVAYGAHGYQDHAVLLIAGADQVEYNGTFRVNVYDADHFSFQLGTQTPATPATGTITVKVAAAGWSKPFAATNVGVYRPADGARHCLRVDDSEWSAIKARVRAYRAMTDADSGVGMYPDLAHAKAGSFNWMRPDPGAGAASYGWTIVADDKAMHLLSDARAGFSAGQGNSGVAAYYFGWFKDVYSLDPDASSLITAGTNGTNYNDALSSGDGSAFRECCIKMWGNDALGNGINSNVEQCHGYLAKSFDSAVESVPFFMSGYGTFGLGQYNTQAIGGTGATPYAQAATPILGDTSGSGGGTSARGFTYQAPFLAEPNYGSGQSQIRGVLPFLQCLSLYPAVLNVRKVLRNLNRFGAAYSTAMGYDYPYGSSYPSAYPRGFVVPLGNWEDVL